MLDHDKRIVLLRHDKKEWLKGCIMGCRLDRDRNHSIQVLMGWEEREDSGNPHLCASRAGMRGLRK